MIQPKEFPPETLSDALVLLEKKEETIAEQAVSLQQFRFELDQLKKLIYGSRHERFVAEENAEQLTLPLGAETPVLPSGIEKQIAYTRKQTCGQEKGKPSRLPLPAHLPRQEEVVEPEGLTPEHACTGEEVTEELELEEARLYVRRIVRPKYVLKNREEEGILVAELPTRPIERGTAGAGLLSSILIGKFVDHLPLYRQIEQFKREGVTIPSSTISDWVAQCCQLLSPLYDTLVRSVKKPGYVKADESPIKVQDRRKKGTTHQGYMWVYEAPLNKQIVFDYQVGRGREGPRKFLKEFSGYLQSDGYIAYECFGKDQGITRLCCMAHARREYTKALDNDRQRAEYVLAQMQQLYKVEEVIRESWNRREQHGETLSAAVIARYRRIKALPVLNGLKEWMTTQLTEGEVLPRSPIGGAIAYSLKRWEELTRYTTDGRLDIDNNTVEGSIRPLALGRKNFLFAGSHAAAQRIAMMYSFMGTCKKNGVEPARWMKDILTRIPSHSANKLEELLPGNWTPMDKL